MIRRLDIASRAMELECSLPKFAGVCGCDPLDKALLRMTPVWTRHDLQNNRAAADELDVDLEAADGGEGVAHGFPDRGMGVNHAHHVVDGAFEIEYSGGFRKDFRGQRADNVDAEYLTSLSSDTTFTKPP